MKPFLLLLIVFLIPSCAPKKTANTDFEKKYGKSIEEIQAQRAAPQERQMANIVASNKSRDWRDENFDPNSYFPHVDMSKFDKKRLPQDFSPNGQNPAERVYVGEKMPDDMFEITYNLQNHPQYKKIGVEFDAIEIPDEDFYQIRTESSDKSYLIIGDNDLRKNIAQTRNSRSSQDIYNSQIIIAEYKEKSRQQKMLHIFNEKPDEEEVKKSKPKKKKITKKANIKKSKTPKVTSFRAKDQS